MYIFHNMHKTTFHLKEPVLFRHFCHPPSASHGECPVTPGIRQMHHVMHTIHFGPACAEKVTENRENPKALDNLPAVLTLDAK
ncbi:hypothetical protein [Aminivibrio sp.]|uniref:hypothetical protein n=1 Tax=Aminivibrio sp. TaxID=1872489 RepID=UPI00345E7325